MGVAVLVGLSVTLAKKSGHFWATLGGELTVEYQNYTFIWILRFHWVLHELIEDTLVCVQVQSSLNMATLVLIRISTIHDDSLFNLVSEFTSDDL